MLFQSLSANLQNIKRNCFGVKCFTYMVLFTDKIPFNLAALSDYFTFNSSLVIFFSIKHDNYAFILLWYEFGYGHSAFQKW